MASPVETRQISFLEALNWARKVINISQDTTAVMHTNAQQVQKWSWLASCVWDASSEFSPKHIFDRWQLVKKRLQVQYVDDERAVLLYRAQEACQVIIARLNTMLATKDRCDFIEASRAAFVPYGCITTYDMEYQVSKLCMERITLLTPIGPCTFDDALDKLQTLANAKDTAIFQEDGTIIDEPVTPIALGGNAALKMWLGYFTKIEERSLCQEEQEVQELLSLASEKLSMLGRNTKKIHELWLARAVSM